MAKKGKRNGEYMENMTCEQADDVISNHTHYKGFGGRYYPRTIWANWFQGQYSKDKSYIVDEIKDNPSLKNAMLKRLHCSYVEDTGKNIAFDDFLDSEIELYRGQTTADKKGFEHEDFISFSTDRGIAEHFGEDVQTIRIKPRDTYGAVRYVGNESEVLVPTRRSKSGLERDEDRLYQRLVKEGKSLDEVIEALEHNKLNRVYLPVLKNIKRNRLSI